MTYGDWPIEHEGKVFKCEDCTKLYSNSSPVLRHRKPIHFNAN